MGNMSANITFDPPLSNGGDPITDYIVMAFINGVATGIFVETVTSPTTITGLTNGVTYTFEVYAVNAVGAGPYSAPSNPYTPEAGVPSAPLNVTAVAGNTQATITFSPPTTDGGSVITRYTATSSPGGFTASGPTVAPLIVTGLTDGVQYTFTVTATNSSGTGPASAPSNAVTPSGVPSAPLTPVAAAANASAIVSFSPPAFNGGTAITSYTVTSSPGNITATGSASPITVTGLTNGQLYTFTVTATNSSGTGPASVASNAVTPLGVPGAPLSPTAGGGNAQAIIAFSPPASNGGSAITSYTATSSPGGFTASGASSPLTVTGLTNGTAYTFTVTATNAIGTGPASSATNSVTPEAAATVPSAPLNPTAAPGVASATVAFSAPLNTGGDPITSYTATSSPGGLTASGAASPLTVTGLTNGTAYTFTVTATNAVGTGPASVATNAVTPEAANTVPSAPLNPVATAGNAQVTVTFSAPLSNGGATITGYTVTGSPSGSASGASSPITVTGLTNGTAYTFTVTATNSVGTGPPSVATVAVTPSTVPTSPLNPVATAGNAQATVTFLAPTSNGGTAITGYTVTSSPGGLTGSLTGATPAAVTVTGLTNGTSYTFTVTATNADGTSPPSVASNAVTPQAAATVPSAPLSPSATAGNAQATVTFTAPTSNGGSAITGYTATAYINGVSTGISGRISGATAAPITVTGLTNGTTYTFEVTATNAFGTSPPSVASNAVTPTAPITVPTAPLSPSAIAGNASAIVSFSPPTSDGGATITGYTVTSSPGGITASGTASPITITGLTNGTSYTFTVTATNSAGTGPPSVATNSVTPEAAATVPSAPLNPVATAGNTTASISFSPPTSTGGDPITSYTVTSTPGGLTATGAASPLTVTGLTNGTSYTFTVKATNAVGTGPASVASNAVIPTAPATVPGPPTNVVATAGNAQASVNFTAPTNTGGDPITSYTVTSTPGGLTGSSSGGPIIVNGLTNGTSYTFTVYATNAVGNSVPSAPSNAVIPSSVPGPPTDVVATFYSGYATVTFNAPTSNGGSPITSYQAYSVPAGGTGSLPVGAAGYDGVIALNSAGKFVNGAGTLLAGTGFNVSGLETSAAQQFAPWYGSPPNWTVLFSLLNPIMVRIPLNEASWLGLTCNTLNSAGTAWASTGVPGAGPSGQAAYQAAVITAIGEAQSRGAYVILDDHWNAPDFTFGGVTAHTLPNFGQPPFMNSNTSGLFHASLAAMFGTQATPQVATLAGGGTFTLQNAGIIFELFNEPYLDAGPGWNATTWAAMKSGGTFTDGFPITGSYGGTAVAQNWTTYGYQQALNAYRSAGATNVLLSNGGGYADLNTNFTSWMPVDTLSPAQLGIGQHPYQSGGLSNTTDTYPENNSAWATATGISAVLAAGIPVIFTEDGGYYGPGLGTTEAHVTYMGNYCNTNGIQFIIGWAAQVGSAGASAGSSGENYLIYATSPPTLTGGQGQAFAALKVTA
jgi:hypothetical protein